MASIREKVVPIKKIDSHLHVWASPEEAKEYPYFPGQETTLIGSSDDLLKSMEEAGVDGALIVQPINYMFDHSYVTSVLQKHPDKFLGCFLADPSDGGNGIAKLEHLVTKEGYKAMRFNPYLWPPNEKMNNEIGRKLFAKAGELGIAVGFMCFKGLLLHVEEIEDLCSQSPSTIVLIDHFGFCKPPLNEVEDKSLTRLLQLARLPQVYVKVSAFFRVSRDEFPYRDTWPVLKRLLSSFGAKRLMWGSDYPFIKNECGYVNAAEILPLAKSEEALLTDDELRWIMGETAQSVFGGAWSKSSS
ncbi:hypothetical protein O6H91_03G044400 [Diphasiastrum complanatum]|uniref:Uncharacterized protein n=1 Tax=Diphasiastrum complanatum TaxID=34168 RepID=A0ACC2E641_DIPCM|nr:hypothetical protein O6H91_03G044400 [Diphasiastrum complanatum]